MRSRETLLRLHRFRTEEKRRQVADIEGMIQDFMRKYDDLDAAGEVRGEPQRRYRSQHISTIRCRPRRPAAGATI